MNMSGIRWLAMISAVLAGLPVLAAAKTAVKREMKTEPREQKVTETTYVYSQEEWLFTGSIVSISTNDPASKAVAVKGHHPLRRESVDKLVNKKDAGHVQDKPPAVTDTTINFHVDAACRISLTNNLPAKLADLTPGTEVDVAFRTTADGTPVANAIGSAAEHPYDGGTKHPKRK